MTHLILAISALHLIYSFPALAETHTYDLPNFSEIVVSNAIDVVYTQGPTQSVNIETDSDAFSTLGISAENGILQLKRRDVASATTISVFDGLNSTILRTDDDVLVEQGNSTNIEISRGAGSSSGIRINGENISDLLDRQRSLPVNIVVRPGLFGTVIKINDRRRSKITAHITTPEITKITSLTGASIEAQKINTSELILMADALGKITVDGECISLEARAVDSSRIDARDLSCSDVIARAEHSAHLKIRGSNEVVARAAHAGRISVHGNPEALRKSQSHRGRIDLY